MTTNSMVRIGIIGLGNILQHHVEGIRSHPEYRITGVCDLDGAKVEEFSRKLGCEGFLDHRKLLNAEVDAVVVALPHGLHCAVAVEAFQAGCHVVVEKPMAVSVAECNHMLAAARGAGRHLIVAECNAFDPGARLTGAKFKAGDLGRFLTGSLINAKFYFESERPAWFLDPAASGGGMFSNLGSHRLAQTRASLPGLRPVSVCGSVCHLRDYTVEACTSAIVKYAQGGSMVYEEVGYFRAPQWLNRGMHLVFERGIVAWDDKAWRMMTDKGEALVEPLPARAPAYAPVYENLLRAIRAEDYGPKPWECAEDVAVVQGAYAGSKEGREIDLRSPEWAVLPIWNAA